MQIKLKLLMEKSQNLKSYPRMREQGELGYWVSLVICCHPFLLTSSISIFCSLLRSPSALSSSSFSSPPHPLIPCSPSSSFSFRSIGTQPGAKVYRHLINGDVLLVNRQPTLHKPGIMAHKVNLVLHTVLCTLNLYK